MKVRHMDAAQRFLFFAQFVPVVILIVFFISCAAGDGSDKRYGEKAEVSSERSARYRDKFKFLYTHLSNGIYLFEFDGHHYLVSGGYNSDLTHTASCPGVHE